MSFKNTKIKISLVQFEMSSLPLPSVNRNENNSTLTVETLLMRETNVMTSGQKQNTPYNHCQIKSSF